MRSTQKLPRWKVTLFLVELVVALLLAAVWFLDHSKPGLNLSSRPGLHDHRKQADELRFAVYRVLFDHGIRVDWISGDRQHKTVRVPRDLPMVTPYAALVARIRELGGELRKAQADILGEHALLEVGLDGKPLYSISFVQDEKLSRIAGKIALVVDDFGYKEDKVVTGFLDLPSEITFSILPGQRKSKRIAEAAAERGHEVMIHLPMQPRNGKVETDGFVLLSGLSKSEIRQRVRKAIAAVPHARGVNNHMGSLATEDERLMSPFLDEIKRNGLFFLDSRTSPKSLAYALARKKGVPATRNDTFLDAIEEKPFISHQLYLLAEIAAKRGWAVGIAHPTKLTLQVLQKELPNLERKGFQFVKISTLLEQEGKER
ncbi:MAG: divergent polysaccharide deacetylase family protein [Calditrichaeota bacterium]|nr:MAG: divergent polysaccharide deacetylase family protein [Calditrichota bacterium]